MMVFDRKNGNLQHYRTPFYPGKRKLDNVHYRKNESNTIIVSTINIFLLSKDIGNF
jgi:hypothetical protein